MLHSRAKLVRSAKNTAKQQQLQKGEDSNDRDDEKKPKLEEFVKKRDYTGAITLLEFQRNAGETPDEKLLPWLGYCAFHLGDYKKALDVYQQLLQNPNSDPQNHLYVACCLYYLGMNQEAVVAAEKGPATRLQSRLLFQLAQKMNDEKSLVKYHAKMTESVEDQLSLAAMHYLRSHFQDATEIYKKQLIDYRDYLALQVYVSLCYYKLDYYDVSLELLGPYIEKFPDSAIAINLKACNQFKLYDGKAAEAELKSLMDVLTSSSQNYESDLVKHNLVVFRNGESALQVLPPLLDIIPESRLNLVIWHLKMGEVMEAYDLVKDLEPSTPQEYILKGVVNACVGQLTDSKEHMKLAQTLYQLVGASASEMDTIPGRQCMASCFFLLKQFEDTLIYLNSVKSYCANDAAFNYNYGVALASCGQYKEAEEALLIVSDEKFRSEYMYRSWLARCLIMNGKPREAWELYLKTNNHDSFNFLVLVANDCYRAGAFYYAAKAFDVLERLDSTSEHWEGKRGACCGVFQQVIARRAKKEELRDVISMLRGTANNPQAQLLVQVMTKWASENAAKSRAV